ncbi:hydrogenase maturation protease [uncultured Thiohalocapsa sp.]|uniref:hydrogenase maturation protease n=1 Tax=uncultured Thiohalocapsa sp. TaxID=768990 RepID=UPI0025E0C2D1|nr:hydrogenase maturation protease [uncultured Thiohalocapsa sp.]
MSLLDPEPDPGQAGARAPRLVIGVGNPARGDDAIGPLLLQRLRDQLAGDPCAGEVALLDAYQLQPEHALDLRGRRETIIVDAAAAGTAPFTHTRVVPEPTPTITTHSLSPAALAGMHQRLFGSAPALTVLAVRGERFELGAPLSAHATRHLAAALDWLSALLHRR